MVREARFCWDDADGRKPPLEQDRFDDFDDDLLDPDPPLNSARAPEEGDKREMGSKRRRSRKRRARRQAESQGRHLAGADWLNETPPDENR